MLVDGEIAHDMGMIYCRNCRNPIEAMLNDSSESAPTISTHIDCMRAPISAQLVYDHSVVSPT
jgi:hypothetical protein